MKKRTKILTILAFFTVLFIFTATGSAVIIKEETVAIQDTYIYQLEHGDTHGSEGNVRVGREPFGSFPLPIVLLEFEGFFKFDLSFDIPMANVTKITLELPITDSARSSGVLREMIFDVWEINDVFDESTTWDNQPVTWDEQIHNVVIIENDADVPASFSVDITEYITNKAYDINDTIFSVGVRRVDTHETRGWIDFGSSESVSKPKIVLDYDDGLTAPKTLLQQIIDIILIPFTFVIGLFATCFGANIVKSKKGRKKGKCADGLGNCGIKS